MRNLIETSFAEFIYTGTYFNQNCHKSVHGNTCLVKEKSLLQLQVLKFAESIHVKTFGIISNYCQ